MAARYGAKVEERAYGADGVFYTASNKELWLVWEDGTALNAGYAALPYKETSMTFEVCEAVAAARIKFLRDLYKRERQIAHGPTLPPDPWVPISKRG